MLSLIVMLCSCTTLSTWPVTVVLFVLQVRLLLCLTRSLCAAFVLQVPLRTSFTQGLGRGVFESTNKATFADFFPGDKVTHYHFQFVRCALLVAACACGIIHVLRRLYKVSPTRSFSAAHPVLCFSSSSPHSSVWHVLPLSVQLSGKLTGTFCIGSCMMRTTV